jgi:membrane-bound metal-dependent hydrolase YbcI (DUF457 family)
MANFKTHIAGAAGVSGVATATLLASDFINPNEAFLLFTLGTIGGILPDIDSPTSIPYKVAFHFFSVIFAFLAIFAKSDYSIIEMIILWSAVYFLSRNVFFPLFDKYTHHRGIFHSVPMAILIGIVTSIILEKMFWFREFTAVWGGVFIAFGYLVHLTLDEMYSVDLMNQRFKKSFGTAFKFWSESKIKTLGVYALIGLLYPVAPDFNIFFEGVTSSQLYSEIFYNLIPNGDRMWFENLINIDSIKENFDN